MAGASIRVVSNRTGIPADTLRVWERRYGFPKPERTAGGSRIYSEDDIGRLMLVNEALAEGYRPNEVVALPRAELEKLLDPSVAVRPQPVASVSVESVIEALQCDDVDAVRALLRAASVTLGPKTFVTDLAHPLAVRVGDLWAEGALEVRHEHLASVLLSTTLRVLLAAHEDGPRSPVIVLATLPGELHGLALDLVGVYLATSLAAPRILGADTPVDQIAAAVDAYGARAVGLSISPSADRRTTNRAVRRLANLVGDEVDVWLGGGGADRLETPASNTWKVTSWRVLDAALARVREAR